MALQNIGAANSDDAFYRYKMPRMVTKIEGRGNGIKTNVVNMVDIAKALARPASYTTKYFGCELGALSKFDEKTGVSLVNGAHDTAKLAALLEKFIKKYVQCYGCGNPETEIIITKNQMLQLRCAACGFVSDVDMRDKLTTFILKNPPEAKKGSKDKKAMRRAEKERLKEGEAADEEQKKLKKELKKKSSAAGKDGPSSKASAKKKANGSDEEHVSPPTSQAGDADADADDDEDVQWKTDTSIEAVRQRQHEQLTTVTAGMVMLSTTEQQEKKAKYSDTEGAGKGDGVKAAKVIDGHQKLVNDIKSQLKSCNAHQLATFVGSLNGNPQDVMSAFVEALFEGVGKGFAKDVAKKSVYLAAVVPDEASQMVLLRALETFLCKKSNSDAVKESPLAAKALYDSDVLHEECIAQWYNEGIVGSNKGAQLWKSMKPFIEWLQNAESESESE